MKINNIILYSFILIIAACNSKVNNCRKLELYDSYRTQKLEKKDSLFILYTIKEWGKRDWYTFADYSKMYKMSNDQIEHFFGGSFYSPDKKKILIWIGQKKPNVEIKSNESKYHESSKLCNNSEKFVYSMTALIGIRDSINQIWALYPFNQQQAICYSSKEYVISILGNYYFKEMKSHHMYKIEQSGKDKGLKISKAYGYNLQDKDFWEKCWLFERDTVGSDGLYPFQIKGYNYNGNRCDKCAEPYIPPYIDYPKSILTLFNN